MRFSKFSLLFYLLFASATLYAQNQESATLALDNRDELFQKAVLYRAEGNYDMAINQLESILSQHKEDAEVLLLIGELHTQNQQYKKAATVYDRLLPMDYKHTITLINLSYVLFMNNKPKTALSYALKAWNKDKTCKSALVNYFNALLWNSKTHHANQIISTYEGVLESDQLLVMKARLSATQGNFVDGLANYKSLVSKFPNRHYVREYVEVLLAKKQIHRAKEVIQSYKDIFSKKENHDLDRKLEEAQLQQLNSGVSYSKDAARNVRMEGHLKWKSAPKKNYQYEVRSKWSTWKTAKNNKAHSGELGLHIETFLWDQWKGVTQLQVSKIDVDQERNITTVFGLQSIQFQPHDRQIIGMYMNSIIMDNNSIQLGKNIRSLDWGLHAHYMTNKRNGLYVQSSVGRLSDGNKKWQMFGSLYQIFGNNPLIKIGVNTSLLQYQNNRMEDYFSPNNFLTTELFAEYSYDRLAVSGLNLKAEVASGIQNIDSQGWTPVFRLLTILSYRIKLFESTIKFESSNAPVINGSGYSFKRFEYSLNLKF